MTSRPARKRPRGEETRDLLIRAALTVLERDGAATTRKIAEEAQVPLGTVHYWFADTDDLYSAVVDALLREVRGEVEEAAAEAGAGRRLRHVYDGFMRMPLRRQLALFEVTARAIRDPQLRHLAREQYEAYRESAAVGLAPWAEAVDAKLPGGHKALTTLIVAVSDGLTLSSLADPDGTDAHAALSLLAELLHRAGITEDASTGAADGGGTPGDQAPET